MAGTAPGKGQAATVEGPDGPPLQRFVRDRVAPGARLATDEAAAYRGRPEDAHEAVNHRAGEYVRQMVPVKGMARF